jgi:Tol biopolymer transport system component
MRSARTPLGRSLLWAAIVPVCAALIGACASRQPTIARRKPPTVADVRAREPQHVATFTMVVDDLSWVPSRHQLSCSWQALPLASIYRPTVGTLDAQTGDLIEIAAPDDLGEDRHLLYSPPAPSHDGRYLAYTAFAGPRGADPAVRELRLHSLEDGSSRRLADLTGWTIQWLPGDRHLAMLSHDQPQPGLLLVDTSSGRATRLSDQSVEDLAVSPDGRVVAYTVWLRPGYELWVVDIATRERRLVAADAWSPSWHGADLWYVGGDHPQPDGSKSSYHGFGDRILRDDPSEDQPSSVAAHCPEHGLATFARISPDGSLLWVLMKDSSLWLVNADGSDWFELAQGVDSVAWSPDGQRLAWASTSQPPGTSSIGILDLSAETSTGR